MQGISLGSAGAFGIAGMRIVTNHLLVKLVRTQTKFPRSKGKRIRKKYAKLYSVYSSVPDTNIYLLGGRTLVCHPAIERKLKEAIDAAQR